MEKEEYLKYLDKINFAKHLKKLEKKLQGKKVVIYGAGMFFKLLLDNFDFSRLNIAAVSDKKYECSCDDKEFEGYKTCKPEEIKSFEPDYVLVGTFKFVTIIESLASDTLKDSGIKIKPLINKPFLEIWKELWG